MEASEKQGIFHALASDLSIRIGQQSQVLTSIAKETKIPEPQLLREYGTEGAKMLEGFVGMIIKNFLHILKSNQVSIGDVGVLATLITADAIGRAVEQGFVLNKEFIDEQVDLYRNGLEEVLTMVEPKAHRTGLIKPI